MVPNCNKTLHPPLHVHNLTRFVAVHRFLINRATATVVISDNPCVIIRANPFVSRRRTLARFQRYRVRSWTMCFGCVYRGRNHACAVETRVKCHCTQRAGVHLREINSRWWCDAPRDRCSLSGYIAVIRNSRNGNRGASYAITLPIHARQTVCIVNEI